MSKGKVKVKVTVRSKLNRYNIYLPFLTGQKQNCSYHIPFVVSSKCPEALAIQLMQTQVVLADLICSHESAVFGQKTCHSTLQWTLGRFGFPTVHETPEKLKFYHHQVHQYGVNRK